MLQQAAVLLELEKNKKQQFQCLTEGVQDFFPIKRDETSFLKGMTFFKDEKTLLKWRNSYPLSIHKKASQLKLFFMDDNMTQTCSTKIRNFKTVL
jgi:hypothetical protein